jgi:ethylbenzene dioxygenase beta subunit
MSAPLRPIRAEEAAPVPEAVTGAVTRFLLREARLLDAEAYADWLDLMHPDIHYWMPGIETRARRDARGAYAYGDMAYFDDRREELRIRVARYEQPQAWADNPRTRHVHLVTNIEVFPARDEPGCAVAFSAFTNIRNRGEKDQDVLYGRREDLVHLDGPRLLCRHIFLAQNVLLSKNLNTFL